MALPLKRPPLWAFTALQQAVAGVDVIDIAKALGKSRAQVNRVLNSDWGQHEMEQWHRAVLAKLGTQRLDPLAEFQSLVGRAIKKVVQKMDCGDEKVELAAALRILDNAGLKPVTPIAFSEDESWKRLTPEEREVVAETGKWPARLTTIAAAYTAGAVVTTEERDADDLLNG